MMIMDTLLSHMILRGTHCITCTMLTKAAFSIPCILCCLSRGSCTLIPRPIHVMVYNTFLKCACTPMLRLSTPVYQGRDFKDSARPAELPRWLSWYSICLECRTSRVRVPPEAALLFLWKKRVVFGCRFLHLPCLYN